eukprot:TRINITY_DN52001_c0_g1_i1.p1 TRINITY_DN52001_c0_g1~~TRINITY_DN52001_c0_g1_i1.p1  ORF type:complete len:357 (+),score=38.53 TRINITY_DN52001_c0_g1_i1:65-1135(+)
MASGLSRPACVIIVVLALLAGVSHRNGFAFALFGVIELLVLPVTTCGGIVLTVTAFAQSRQAGTSLTAFGPLIGRYALHELGVRHDVGTQAMAQRFFPSFALWATFGPTLFASRISSFEPRRIAELVGYPPGTKLQSLASSAVASVTLRTHIIDSAVRDLLPSMDQLVVLGAGFDSRTLDRSNWSDSLKIFEVDSSKTQPTKRKTLDALSFNSSHIVFVGVDFNTEDWLTRLTANGFETSKRTLFIWEGVCYYLTPAAVHATLRNIAQCSSGSAVVLDYFTSDLAAGVGVRFSIIQRVFQVIGEPLLFGVDMTVPSVNHAARWMSSVGLRLTSHAAVPAEMPGRSQLAGALVAVVP